MKIINKDIIITDPCYIIVNSNKTDDWKKCNYGYSMEVLGIEHYLTNNANGEWTCITLEKDTNKKLGNFCSDYNLVSVFILDEVRNYNSNIDKWIKSHLWCVTKIPNFTGEIKIQNNMGEIWVEGKGNINFYTKQL